MLCPSQRWEGRGILLQGSHVSLSRGGPKRALRVGVGHPLISGDRVIPFPFGCRVQSSWFIHLVKVSATSVTYTQDVYHFYIYILSNSPWVVIIVIIVWMFLIRCWHHTFIICRYWSCGIHVIRISSSLCIYIYIHICNVRYL